MAVRWSLPARNDLERIWHFHADRNPLRADRIENQIRERADQLSERPLLGRVGERPGTREYLIRDIQYVLIYTAEDYGIRVTRVWSSRERP